MGTRGDEGLARQPRGDRRLDRARRATPTCSTPWSRIGGCDKTIPGTVMALCRLERPERDAVRRLDRCPATSTAEHVTIQDVFEAVGAHAAGKITDERAARDRGRGVARRRRVRRPVHRQHDGDGVRDARASRPAGFNGVPAIDAKKAEVAHERRRAGDGRPRPGPCGRATSSPARASRTRSPRSRASGGSTNGVLHLLAIASEMGVELSIDDFDRISERTPLLVRPEARRPVRRARPVRGRRRRRC